MASPADTAQNLEATGWEVVSTGHFVDMIGPLWRKLHGRRYRYGIMAAQKHANHRGIVHGGVILTLCDHAVGMASAELLGHDCQVTTQLDTHFVDAARVGEFLVGQGEVVRSTASLVFVRGTIESDGRIVAVTQGVWKIVRPRSA